MTVIMKNYNRKVFLKDFFFLNSGIQGAFDSPGSKTVIPGKVIGKFSIRIVPKQDPSKIEKLVVDYLNKIHGSRGSPNKLAWV